MDNLTAEVQEACDRLIAGYEQQRARITPAIEEAAEAESAAVEAASPPVRDLASMWT